MGPQQASWGNTLAANKHFDIWIENLIHKLTQPPSLFCADVVTFTEFTWLPVGTDTSLLKHYLSFILSTQRVCWDVVLSGVYKSDLIPLALAEEITADVRRVRA